MTKELLKVIIIIIIIKYFINHKRTTHMIGSPNMNALFFVLVGHEVMAIILFFKFLVTVCVHYDN